MFPFCSSLCSQPSLCRRQHFGTQFIHFRAVVVAGQMPEPVGQKPEAMLLRILPVQERFPVQGVDGKDEAPELDGDVFVLRPGDLLVLRKR